MIKILDRAYGHLKVLSKDRLLDAIELLERIAADDIDLDRLLHEQRRLAQYDFDDEFEKKASV